MHKALKATGSLVKGILMFLVRTTRVGYGAVVIGLWGAILEWFGGGRLRHDYPEEAEDRPDELFKLGELCAAVYTDTEFIMSGVDDGFTLKNGWILLRIPLPDTNGMVFLLTNKEQKRHIIASRGTVVDFQDKLTTKYNIRTDMSYRKEFSEKLDTWLHRGFKKMAEEAWDLVKPHLNKDYYLSFTGHSLGGACAVIEGMLAKVDGYKVSKVVTFGQPKVTNYVGACEWDNDNYLPVTRIIHSIDSVPCLPPRLPTDLIWKGNYWHFGVEIHIDDRGTRTQRTSAEARASGSTNLWFQYASLKRIPIVGAVGHPMLKYLESMCRWVPKSKRLAEDCMPEPGQESGGVQDFLDRIQDDTE